MTWLELVLAVAVGRCEYSYVGSARLLASLCSSCSWTSGNHQTESTSHSCTAHISPKNDKTLTNTKIKLNLFTRLVLFFLAEQGLKSACRYSLIWWNRKKGTFRRFASFYPETKFNRRFAKIKRKRRMGLWEVLVPRLHPFCRGGASGRSQRVPNSVTYRTEFFNAFLNLRFSIPDTVRDW